MRRFLPLLFAIGLPGSIFGEGRGVWLCDGPADLLKQAQPLCELRASQGWTVKTSSATPKEAIASLPEKPAAILLLGDDSANPSERRPYHGWMPNHPAEFVTDSVLGDLDGDGVPDIPVGRLPGHTPEEISQVVTKILAWEKRTPSLNDLTVPVWSGDPGFAGVGEVMKQIALPFFMRQLHRDAPPWADFWLMQSDPRSPFCGWPAASSATFNARMGQGSLFNAMIGHGSVASWWIMDVPGGQLRYRAEDARTMKGSIPSAPEVIFACRCGAFADPRQRCLGAELLFAPGGPVACVAASVDSHPLTNYYGSTSLLASLKDPGDGTFGGLWVKSIRRAHGRHELLAEVATEFMEPFFIGRRNPVKSLKADHLLIYNLLGDPATRMFFPQPLEAAVKREKDGWTWSVPKPEGLPEGAKLIVQQRALLSAPALGKPATDPVVAAKMLEEGNAKLNFHTIRELGAGEEWSGAVTGAGTLRLCLVGGPELKVFATSEARGIPDVDGFKVRPRAR